MRLLTRRGGTARSQASTRRDGVPVSASTVMRALRDENLLQAADYQRERRKLAAARKGRVPGPADRPDTGVWQLDFLRLARRLRAGRGGSLGAGT